MINYKLKKQIEKPIIRNYSQASQDLFVLMCLNGKSNGTYLEIGASEPIEISNTYLLESEFGWNGTSIDIEEHKEFRSSRKNNYLVQDALKINYTELLKDFPKRIDYLSLDIDPMHQTLECLKLLPLSEYRFSVITYEHDYYSQNPQVSDPIRAEARKILWENGYTLLCSDVCVNVANTSWVAPFEDWWIDPKEINVDEVNMFLSSMNFHGNIVFKNQ
jgi:hypothetical protein